MNYVESEMDFYRECNSGNYQSERAKRYKTEIRKLLKKYYNGKIQTQVRKQIPKMKFTSKAVKQMTFAANEVSHRFKKPTELIGVLGGRMAGKSEFITSFHVFQNQVCNSINTKVDAIGRVDTYRDLKQKKIKYLDIAHSHNVMDVFHSNLDDVLLNTETICSDNGFNIDLKFRNFFISYSNSTVFNQKGELFVKTGMLIPVLTETGFVQRYVTTKPDFGYCKYGDLTLEDKLRLKDEIKSNVTYQRRIVNKGFTGDF